MALENVLAMSRSVFLRRILCLAGASMMLLTAGCGKDEPLKSAEARPRLHVCDYDITVFFGAAGDSDRFRLLGWSATEDAFTWTDGIGASLGVRLPASEHPVRMSLKAAGMNAPGRLPFQPVDVFVNGEKIASWQVADEKVHTAIIPQVFVQGPESFLFIDFHMPKVASPSSLGHGSDGRRLGMRVVDLRFRKAPEEARPAGAQP
jgi:hypothetical protein